jgi:hypothetical protein
VDEDELAELREIARWNPMTLAEWARQVPREAWIFIDSSANASENGRKRNLVRTRFP